jgi:hypothetical protein
MTNSKLSILTLGLLAAAASDARAAVKLTAMQIVSTETNGKIQGVGAHRFKTTQHGGQPCIFVVEGDDLDAPILNGPDPAHNGLDAT